VRTLVVGLGLAAATVAIAAGASAPIALDGARVTIAGTSNIHAYTASTTAVRVTELRVAPQVAGPALWDRIVEPGALEAFAIAIPAATLTSPKDGLDKNMHKALKVKEHAEITFRLERLASSAAFPGALTATGVLQIAGVEREVTFDLTTARDGDRLVVKGEVDLLMTDFDIKPPKAMLGMLRTDPKVTVRFETAFTLPTT
jgi:hypothetical protein